MHRVLGNMQQILPDRLNKYIADSGQFRILSLYRSHAPVPLFRSQFVHSAMGVVVFLI